ncbi:hypothetical protein F511_38449 [Dorcoceras hygrometricum]|uniref:Uncharacterized protein n=1 Tax=Dorcoceras hygrometricum TaxID=472368 RepID=A0A2Z7CNK2_9LAMI|nr:hypothetical protein F511_38449 [Dorcoceras hygrometricum]
MSASHNKIPMFSKEDYDDWKIRMQVHLAAQDDDIWSVITDGPMKIMKINIAFATSDGAPEYVEKRRHEYTLHAILLVYTLLCITIEHDEPLGSLGLNGVGDDPAEFTPTGACLSYRRMDEIRAERNENNLKLLAMEKLGDVPVDTKQNFVGLLDADLMRLGDSQSEILFKIDHLEKTFVEALTQQDLAFRSLIKSVRQEAQNQEDITSIELKAVRAQNLADTRKVVQELKAVFSNDILDFRAQAQENYNNLTTQLFELVDYINRGGIDKKGENSNCGPHPPPDDRDRSGSGGFDGRNRGGRSESSMKRYFSSGGGP